MGSQLAYLVVEMRLWRVVLGKLWKGVAKEVPRPGLEGGETQKEKGSPRPLWRCCANFPLSIRSIFRHDTHEKNRVKAIIFGAAMMWIEGCSYLYTSSTDDYRKNVLIPADHHFRSSADHS